jgi:hypothetical protein
MGVGCCVVVLGAIKLRLDGNGERGIEKAELFRPFRSFDGPARLHVN